MNHKRVLRLMRDDNLLCLRRKSFLPATTDSRHGWRVWPNLARHLVPTAIDQLWVADITYVRLAEAFAYLAVILDAFSRKVIGPPRPAGRVPCRNQIEGLLAFDGRYGIIGAPNWRSRHSTWRSPAGRSSPDAWSTTVIPPRPAGRVSSGDRIKGLLAFDGVQYAFGDDIARLQARGIQPSMSRIACPWDNAPAESFTKTLKHEEVDGRNNRMIDDAKSAIGAFIDDVYNTQRLHSALNYQAPVVFETRRATQLAAAQQPAGWLSTDCV